MRRNYVKKLLVGILLPCLLNFFSFIFSYIMGSYVFGYFSERYGWFFSLILFFIISFFISSLVGYIIEKYFFSAAVLVFLISLSLLSYPIFFFLAFENHAVLMFLIIWLAIAILGGFYGHHRRVSV